MYDRQIKCIIITLAEFANTIVEVSIFDPVLINVMKYST